MAQDITYAYVGGLTAKRGEDGFMRVKGLATDATLDLDEQICDPEWLKTAMPKWMEIGNIREMHASKAVGKAMEMQASGSGYVVEAKIVDREASMKVEEGIYTGFSVGIKGARVVKDASAPGGRIIAGHIVEVSLVDRPANPSAIIEIAKTVGGTLIKGAAVEDIVKEIDQDMTEVELPYTEGQVVYEGRRVCDACSGTGCKTNTPGGVEEKCEVCAGSGIEPEGRSEHIIMDSEATNSEDENHAVKELAAETVKMNENHDEAGRFASSDGGSAGDHASTASEHAGKALSEARIGFKDNARDAHLAAAEAHSLAAEAHRQAASEARYQIDGRSKAQDHSRAAALHEKASSAHERAAVLNELGPSHGLTYITTGTQDASERTEDASFASQVANETSKAADPDLVKMNENHDEAGRFASSDGGGGLQLKESADKISADSKANNMSANEMDRIAAEHQELANAHYDVSSGSDQSTQTGDAHAMAGDLHAAASEAWSTTAVAASLGDKTTNQVQSARELTNAAAKASASATKTVTPDLAKRQFTQSERTVAAAAGHATPSGSFPINNVEDLKNAIRSQGRAKDRDQVLEHIKTRAAALRRPDLIPDAWKTVEHDPATLAAVRTNLIALIKAELDEIASGVEDETCDVKELLSSLELFLCWWDGESDEGETVAPFQTTDDDMTDQGDMMAYIGLGVSADLLKTAAADDATPEVRDELRHEIVKALGLETEIATYKAALSKQEEELTLLKAALDEVREMAAPGGPVLRQTGAQASKSAHADSLRVEAARRRQLAGQLVDPQMRNEYLKAAQALDAQADQI